MQVWCTSIAGIAKEAQLVANVDVFSDLDLYAARMEVSVEAVEPIAMIYDYVVAIDVLQVERAGVGSSPGV